MDELMVFKFGSRAGVTGYTCSQPGYCDGEYVRLSDHETALAAAQKRERVLREALEYYADPNTYFAIGFFPDFPCGDFINDFGNVFDEYEMVDSFKPGKKARAALERKEV